MSPAPPIEPQSHLPTVGRRQRPSSLTHGAPRSRERDVAQRVPQRASESAETGSCTHGSQRTIESAGREDRQSERES